MLFAFYFTLCAIESFLLSAYMAAVGSHTQNNLIFNLSPSRLAIVMFFILCGFGFLILAYRSLNTNSKTHAFQQKYLDDETSQWRIFIIALGVVALVLVLLTRQLNSFGDFKLVYQNFEPALVWLALIAAQTAFLTAIWYFAFFIPDDKEKNINTVEKELIPLFVIFLGLIVLKLLFVTRTFYGPVGRGDEMTYFDMVDSLYRGFFSVAQSYQYPPMYALSIMISPVFNSWTFDSIKLLNAVYSSSIIFPVYFIARRFLDTHKSLIATFLSCLISYHLVFPRRIVSENLYFPLFLWTMLITFVIPHNKRYRLLWDILNGVMIAVLYLTRYITLAVIPIFILCWWIKPFDGEHSLFNPGWKKFVHFCLMIAAMLAAFSPWLLGWLNEKVQLKYILGFGIASRPTPEQLTLPNLLTWAVMYISYYILVAAPVLHLLIVSLFQLDFKKWREGFERWVIQVLAIMGGFFVAATRHSWREYYNREIPSAIMGRYLIVFSVLYFVIALTALSQFKQSNFRSKWRFILMTQVLPLILVTFAYLTIIEGAVFPTDGNLLKSLGSVDAAYIKILGRSFFVLLFLIYGISGWLIWKGIKRTALTAMVVGLVVYFVVGIPAYYQELMEFQTYPWLASQIAKLAPQPDPKSGDTEQITVFLPAERQVASGAEIYNGLRTRGIDNTEIKVYSPDAVDAMTTDKGFIIQVLGMNKGQYLDYPIFRINNQEFVIIPVQK